MIYPRFYTNVIIRTVSITFTGLVLAYVVMKQHDLYVAFNVLLLIIVQTVLMIQYINRINRDLAHFFDAISNDDSNVVYRKKASGKTFQVLYESFDQINVRIQALKLENSRRTFYLQHLVEHAGIGIISYAAGNGKLDIVNPAARKLLNITSGVTVLKINELSRMTGLALGEIRPGEQRLLQANQKNDSIPLSIMASDFVFRGETTRLLTFQGIRSELEDNEIASWQKLIKTLTHEIVNSIGPISSTIKTMKSFYAGETLDSQNEQVVLPVEKVTDTICGLEIIDERAQGLLDFVSKFRSLTILPTVNKSTFKIRDLLAGIKRLFDAEIEIKQIELSLTVSPESLCVTTDKQLLEQVIINLLTNSIHAFSETQQKRIRLSAFSDYIGRIWIQVYDNGKGISEEISDKVFVPFFTTWEKGSGIGLSLSRQIMRLLNGKISFSSVPGIETIFTLVL